MLKFIGTWKNSTTDEMIEISGVYPGDYYFLKYDFSNGEFQKGGIILINIITPKEANEIEVFYTPHSERFAPQLFTVCKDCLTIDNQEFDRVK
jgi:hypothetical protein